MKKKKSTRKKKPTKPWTKWIWPLATMLAILTAAIFGGLYLFSTNNSKNASAYEGAAASAGDGASPQSVRENNGINSQGGGNVQGDGATVEQPTFSGDGTIYKPVAPITIHQSRLSVREPPTNSPFKNFIAYLRLHPEELTCAQIDISLAPDFSEMATTALTAFDAGDLARATHYATVADEYLDEAKYYSTELNAPFSDDFKRKLMQNTSIRIQAAWELGDYSSMRKRLKDLSIYANTENNPRFKAYSRVADKERYDWPFYEPPEDELQHLLKSRANSATYDYLNCLASWGYLLPERYNSFTKRYEPADYERLFGFTNALDYATRYFYIIKCLDSGKTARSHEYIMQRFGFGNKIGIRDVTRCKARNLGFHTLYDGVIEFETPPPLVTAEESGRIPWHVPVSYAKNKEPGEMVDAECSLVQYEGAIPKTIWTARRSVPVPEPSATLLLLLGLVGLTLKRKLA